MALTSELMGVGVPALVAKRIGMDAVTASLKATGSTKATALALLPGFSLLGTVSASTGAALPIAERGAPVLVFNGGANTLSIYTGNATDVINANSAGAAFSVTAGKSCLFWPAGTQWIANLSA